MRVRGPTNAHPVPISAGLCHQNAGAMSAVFAPRRPPRKRAVLATGQQIILPFSCRSCSARSTNWQSGNLTKCALIQTTLRFVCRAVCDAQRNGKMICCPVVENAEPHLPICQRSGEKIGTGCVFVGPRTRHQTNTIWSGLRPDTLDTVPATR